MGNAHWSRTLPWPERFWAKVDKSGDCWQWQAATVDGYGIINSPLHDGTHHRAHRIAWEMEVGPIPSDRMMDHLCRNRGCD